MKEALIYYFLFGSLIFWSCFLLCDLSLKKASSKLVTYATITIVYIAVSVLYFMTSFSTMTFIEYVIGFLPFIVIPLLYKDNVAKIVFVYFSNMLFSLMIHLTSNMITNHIYTDVREMNIISDLTADLLFQVLAVSLMILYLILIATLLKKAFRKMLQPMVQRTAIIACLFPLSAFLILLWDFVNLTDLTNLNSNVIALSTLMVLLLIMYFVLYALATKTTNQLPIANPKQKGIQSPSKSSVLADPMDLLTSACHYYEMILNHFMDMDERTHNLDQHLQTMNSLLTNNNVTGATIYMERISQSFHDHELLPVCNNQSINMLFSYYQYLCQKESIYLETHIDLPSNLFIPDLDLCIVFGNLIENAIEACRFVKNEKERFINVDCKVQGGSLMIIMDNSFDGFINKVNEQLKSRKKFGGIGLKTIHAVIAKYQGSIEMEYPKNVFSIFLKLQLQPTNSQLRQTRNEALPQKATVGKQNRGERRRGAF